MICVRRVLSGFWIEIEEGQTARAGEMGRSDGLARHRPYGEMGRSTTQPVTVRIDGRDAVGPMLAAPSVIVQ